MQRSEFVRLVKKSFRVNPVVALLGPRQCGKTTLAREVLKGQKGAAFFDLENPNDVSKLDNPLLALEHHRGLVVIDEIQKRPDLFEVLRVLVDRSKRKPKFLILGSASRDLIHQGSESLAGRISLLELTPFQLTEVGDKNLSRLWIRGGFPLSFLAPTFETSVAWRKSYIETFLERDIPSLGFKIASRSLRRFWMMLAHYHGQTLNSSEIGRSLGVSDHTVRHYLEILSGTFMVRELYPWIENIGKRQVKAPKIYFRDSGIFHTLLGFDTEQAVLDHPKLGASWEGFALEEVIRMNRATSQEAYFWSTHSEAELDLLIIKGQKRIGYEFKYGDSPRLTKSMQIAMTDLKLDQLLVVFPGKDSYPLAKNVRAIGLQRLVV